MPAEKPAVCPTCGSPDPSVRRRVSVNINKRAFSLDCPDPFHDPAPEAPDSEVAEAHERIAELQYAQRIVGGEDTLDKALARIRITARGYSDYATADAVNLVSAHIEAMREEIAFGERQTAALQGDWEEQRAELAALTTQASENTTLRAEVERLKALCAELVGEEGMRDAR